MATSQGAALDYLSREFGGTFRDQSAVVAVNVAQIPLCGGDADRVSLIMVNHGAQAIWVTHNPPAVVDNGIMIGGGGGIVGFNVRDDGLLPVLQWWAIAAVGPNNTFVLQVRRDTWKPPVELGL